MLQTKTVVNLDSMCDEAGRKERVWGVRDVLFLNMGTGFVCDYTLKIHPGKTMIYTDFYMCIYFIKIYFKNKQDKLI